MTDSHESSTPPQAAGYGNGKRLFSSRQATGNETPCGGSNRSAAPAGPDPAQGPRILFFSGGSAINPLAEALARHTSNTIHLVTPFDSGGSSAELRRTLAMPAVGDLRHRLSALSDPAAPGNGPVRAFLEARLPFDEPDLDLRARLRRAVTGRAWVTADLPSPFAGAAAANLAAFEEAMPRDFNLAGACLGNLVLAGGFLKAGRDLTAALDGLARLTGTRGVIRPIVGDSLHLAARLANGARVVGQHRITGRETPPLSSPITEIFLTNNPASLRAVRPPIDQAVVELIGRADLICYPVGSFYSSVAANLLCAGVGRAVAANPCPKIYIPNTGFDPESAHVPPADLGAELVGLLAGDTGPGSPIDSFLNAMLVDSDPDLYPGGLERRVVTGLGLELVERPLTTRASRPLLDADLLAAELLCLAGA